MELIPKAVQQLWNIWGIRFLVTLSLLCQIILTLFGSRRNRSKSIWMRIIIWSTYMLADWVAKFLLSALTSFGDDREVNISKEAIRLQSSWTAFLLLHLGGPDTITAYSLEDSELWLRSCIGLFLYVAVAIYILLTYWSNDLLGYFSILWLFIGIIKYVERIWLLRSKSKEHLRDHSLFNERLLGQKNSEGLGEGSKSSIGKNSEGLGEGSKSTIEKNSEGLGEGSKSSIGKNSEGLGEKSKTSIIGSNSLFLAYVLYAKFLCQLFLNSNPPKSLDIIYRDSIMPFFKDEKIEDIFRLMQCELRLVYQVLYTKATIFSSLLGILIRCISFISLVATLAIFLAVIVPKSSYQTIDIVITCTLLTGAIFVEVCSFTILFLSDWQKVCLFNLNLQKESSRCTNVDKFKVSIVSPFIEMDPKLWSWSESMGQYNLISCCIKKATSHRFGVGRLLTMNNRLEKQHNVRWKEVTCDLQQFIFRYIRDKFRSRSTASIQYKWRDHSRMSLLRMDIFKFWDPDGSAPDRKAPKHIVESLEDFGHSILVFHIATEICYKHDDWGKQEEDSTKNMMMMCRRISGYMLYLYVMHPTQLGGGINQKWYSELHDEVIRFCVSQCQDYSEHHDEVHRFGRFQYQYYDELRSDVIDLVIRKCQTEETNKTLSAGCNIAQKLQELAYKEGNEKKWKKISEIWMKKLVFASVQGEWEQHLQQLRRGGELLTYVRLLFYHYKEYDRDKDQDSTSSTDKGEKRKYPSTEKDDELVLLEAGELGQSTPAERQTTSKRSKATRADGNGDPPPIDNSIPRSAQRAQKASQSSVKDKRKRVVARTLTPCSNRSNHRSSDHPTRAHSASSVRLSQTPGRDPKASSLTFDPHLFPFVSILPDFVPRDHLASTGLPSAEGHVFLHHLSRTLSQAAYEARVGAMTVDMHKQNSSTKVQSLQKELDALKVEHAKLESERKTSAELLEDISGVANQVVAEAEGTLGEKTPPSYASGSGPRKDAS